VICNILIAKLKQAKEAKEAPLKIDINLVLKKEIKPDLVNQGLAFKFFKVFIISTQVTNFAKLKEGMLKLSKLLMQIKI